MAKKSTFRDPYNWTGQGGFRTTSTYQPGQFAPPVAGLTNQGLYQGTTAPRSLSTGYVAPKTLAQKSTAKTGGAFQGNKKNPAKTSGGSLPSLTLNSGGGGQSYIWKTPSPSSTTAKTKVKASVTYSPTTKKVKVNKSTPAWKTASIAKYGRK